MFYLGNIRRAPLRPNFRQTHAVARQQGGACRAPTLVPAERLRSSIERFRNRRVPIPAALRALFLPFLRVLLIGAAPDP